MTEHQSGSWLEGSFLLGVLSWPLSQPSMPFIDNEEFCLVTKTKPQKTLKNKPNPPSIKNARGYKNTTNSKNSWRENWAHESLKIIPFSTEYFLYSSGTRNNQATNCVSASFARKERWVCSARTWERMLLATILSLTLSLSQYSSRWISVSMCFPATARNVYQGWLHELETSETPNWHKLVNKSSP